MFLALQESLQSINPNRLALCKYAMWCFGPVLLVY
ncbi:unnamed protein product [Brassica oleracea var. botrytis]